MIPWIMKSYVLLSLMVVSLGCNQQQNAHPRILIVTSFGDVEVELYPDKAPITVAAFLSYVDTGLYSNSAFYRVVMQEGMSAAANVGLIQGGTWPPNVEQSKAIKGIEHEPTQLTGLTHTSGAISLARNGPGTASTEFFICIGDQTQFDYGMDQTGDGQGFAAFGKVVKGMPVVRKIQQQPMQGQQFTEPIRIQKIKRR